MKVANQFVAVAVIATAAATPALGQEFVGAFEEIEGDFFGAAFNGSEFVADPFDVYAFNVTNNTQLPTEVITVSFSGEFLQDASSSQEEPFAFEESDFAAFVAGAVEPDTFIVFPELTTGSFLPVGGITDTESELSGSALSITGLDDSFILPGETQTVAIFSVAEGGSAPVFEGGLAVVVTGPTSQDTFDIVIPEPASIALLAVGLGLAGLRRRNA